MSLYDSQPVNLRKLHHLCDVDHYKFSYLVTLIVYILILLTTWSTKSVKTNAVADLWVEIDGLNACIAALEEVRAKQEEAMAKQEEERAKQDKLVAGWETCDQVTQGES